MITLNSRTRLLLSGAIAAVTAGVFRPPFAALRFLMSWDLGSLCFVMLTWRMMLQATPQQMRRRAQQQDNSRLVILILITIAAVTSLLAIGVLLSSSHEKPDAVQHWHLALSLVTIGLSWFLVHTMFTLHYAHLYYRDSAAPIAEAAKGLDFPQDDDPDYWDFAYFSFVIGVTSQVSDVAIISRPIRRLALIHGVLSFFFNTGILALSINLIAGLL